MDMILYSARETIEPRRLCPPERRGDPPDERKEGMPMYVTYQDLIQIGIFICALVGLCYKVFRRKK